MERLKYPGKLLCLYLSLNQQLWVRSTGEGEGGQDRWKYNSTKIL